MSFYLTPDRLPQGSSVTFYDSSFFKRCPEQPKLPTPSEVLARPNYVQHPQAEDLKIRQPAVFKELGLVVKYSDNSDAIIREGQCLWAIRHFLPEVPVPEVFCWTQENGVTFLYMEYIDGVTLRDRWDTLSAIEKSGVCEQLGSMITKMSRLHQAPGDPFIGNINRGAVRDMVFTDTNFPPAGPFSSAAEFHDCMSDMFKRPATANDPDLDPASITDPYREMLPDDCPIQFTHSDLNPVNIMVSQDSPCRILAILDWEQSGWYPTYWEFCKAELTVELHSEWQTLYLPKILDQPDCIEGFYAYVCSFAP
ncbi:phosphotransferase family [Fusarium sp. NRRL 52700]|nr:phosphotransferase family [Fusarium sp. NRRL 52700]